MEGKTAREAVSANNILVKHWVQRLVKAESLPMGLMVSKKAVRKRTLSYFVPSFAVNRSNTTILDNDIPGVPQPSR